MRVWRVIGIPVQDVGKLFRGSMNHSSRTYGPSAHVKTVAKPQDRTRDSDSDRGEGAMLVESQSQGVVWHSSRLQGEQGSSPDCVMPRPQ